MTAGSQETRTKGRRSQTAATAYLFGLNRCALRNAHLSLYTTQSDGSYKLAHQVEHLSDKQNVAGANPALRTKTLLATRVVILFSIRKRREVTSIARSPSGQAATSFHSRDRPLCATQSNGSYKQQCGFESHLALQMGE